MVGNSLKSDVLPVLSIGGHGYHIPYHTTWAHEVVENTVEHANFKHFESIRLLLPSLLL
jgi:putative hydrolase of the HAD superfamily